MNVHVYKMTCLTNLHVGNGDVNYSIIDNEVEKDPVLGEPMIPSSGIKGALLSHIKETEMSPTDVSTVFGDDKGRGAYKFLAGHLLSRPIRVSEGKGAYVNATSYELIEYYESLLKELGINDSTGINSEKGKTLSNSRNKSAEGISIDQTVSNKRLEELSGKNWMITDEKMLGMVSLPVTARNKLSDTGESLTLWYEEFVPYHSVFFTVIITPGKENKLDQYIDGKIVQFGANATIGYGLTRIDKLF